MSTQTKPQIKQWFAAAGIASAAVLGALLIPTTAHAADTGAQTTEASITVTEAGAPAAGETVLVDAAWPELLPGGSDFASNTESASYEQAKARYDRAQAADAAYFTAQDRPAQRAYDQAYQRYLAGTGSAQQWLATMPAQSAEMREIQKCYDGTPLAAESRAASQALSVEKKEMLAQAREVREVVTDSRGELTVSPAIGGGVAHPSVGLSSGAMQPLPFAPSSTTELVVAR
ncbi:hypothetical protein [Leucobacter chromiireducens]|uniref:Uncharacterized protein n=1 Tax=Leucobacter chromiireducens subsp. solipictus TaxID=398235 RepID=A0ABS1SJ60_9MICO|nr:hypothetical protein [Leucobacter chromiireducens]MBL3679514.1 hypothetical protein [Leucobacter chromiireducens subsp. solipictus]